MKTHQQELALRQQIDLAIGRALVDRKYAVGLLAHPAQTLDIDELGKMPNGSLQELATHAKAVFWSQG